MSYGTTVSAPKAASTLLSFPVVCSSPARIACGIITLLYVSYPYGRASLARMRVRENFPVPILQAIGAWKMKVWPVRLLPISLHGGVEKWGVSSDYAEAPVSLVKWAGLR